MSDGAIYVADLEEVSSLLEDQLEGLKTQIETELARTKALEERIQALEKGDYTSDRSISIADLEKMYGPLFDGSSNQPRPFYVEDSRVPSWSTIRDSSFQHNYENHPVSSDAANPHDRLNRVSRLSNNPLVEIHPSTIAPEDVAPPPRSPREAVWRAYYEFMRDYQRGVTESHYAVGSPTDVELYSKHFSSLDIRHIRLFVVEISDLTYQQTQNLGHRQLMMAIKRYGFNRQLSLTDIDQIPNTDEYVRDYENGSYDEDDIPF